MRPIQIYAVLLLTIGSFVVLFETLGRQSKSARVTAAIACMVLTLRYLYWRLRYTAPIHGNALQHAYADVFLTCEVATLCSSLMVYFFMSRTVDRSAQADLHGQSPLRHAATDVFIASYNENRDILERTIIGALALHHPDLRVWLLDDGARPWARELAESLGVMYVSRVKGKHAKAGNINNAMQHALATGRRPEFLLLLDADFIPHRHLLQRVLGLFDTPDVGIVQTPQHFFNPDPVQSNLLCSSVWPDEQRFFFNSLLPAKDAWGAAFCCGTSAVFRVEAFVKAGGMATETVTEDMLTTFKFEEYGFRTIFLNERLSLGLAPESLLEFMAQRSRWCLGAIQQIFTPWSFFGRRLSWINRVAFFDTVLYWCCGAAFKLMLLSAPMLYWFTGTTVLHAAGSDLLAWAGPMIVANMMFMGYLTGNRVLPIMTDVTQLLTAFVICRTVLTALVRPFGRAFRVTAKGLSTSGITVQWGLLWKFAALSALTLLGLFTHIARFNASHGTQGYATNLFWSLINAGVLALAGAACIELPHRRRDERFDTYELATLRIGSDGVPCRLKDISLGGALLEWQPSTPGDQAADAREEPPWARLAVSADLVLRTPDGDVTLPCTPVQHQGQRLTVRFHQADWIRHTLIRKLFTGDYHQEIETISLPKVFGRLAYAVFK